MNTKMPVTNDLVGPNDEPRDDACMERWIIVFLVIMLIAVVFIPSEWLIEWSMWWNDIK